MQLFDHEPPQWALRFLRFYCKPRVLEIIEGDAYELFYKRIEAEGIRSARRRFSWDVLKFFRWKYIKGLEDINSLNNIAMLKNYFKISMRSLVRQRHYTLINISGLAVGLAACLLILLYVNHELSYDKFHKDADRLYYVANNGTGSYTPARLGIQMKMDFPEIEEIARIQGPFSQTFKIDDQVFKEDFGYNADSTFHKIFSLDFLEGNPDEALRKPRSLVVTQSFADKLFNYERALGKTVSVDGETLLITGVVADPPKNTHFKYKYINSFPNESWATVGNWTGNNFFTYAKLQEGATTNQVKDKMGDFVETYLGDDIISYTGHSSYEEYIKDGGNKTFTLLPMTDLHLHYPWLARGSSGSIDNVYIFSAVAVFILLIACINFMNLSTARSAMRSKEVGMRKVLGSLRGQLISQFLIESVLVCLFASVLALVISILVLNGFNQLADRSFGYSDVLDLKIIGGLVLLMLVVGFLAGSYPALVLSSFKPIKALKGDSKMDNGGNAGLRKGLVAFQFAISIFLIVSTLVVSRQLNFIKGQDLGFTPERVLIVKNVSSLESGAQVVRQRLNQIPSITSVSMTTQYLSQNISDWGYRTVEEVPRPYSFRNFFATDQFLNTMGIELKDGRLFNNDMVSDTANLLINESAAKWLGWEEPIGQKLSRGDGEVYTIVGVVKDFNFESLKRDISPMVIRMMQEDGTVEGTWKAGNYLSIKVEGDLQSTITEIEDMWKTLVPNEPFEYEFQDESFKVLYEEEERFGKLFTASSGLAIAIACLGLFALAAFTLERKYKEIAVRKVLGASVQQITLMIIKQFSIIVLIGTLIAIPAGYLIMGDWLSDFAYQINLNNPLIWFIPTLAVACIAWLTVGIQSYKTAVSNPINALRSE